jgi:O-antigen/teichoic acid export membrane protein
MANLLEVHEYGQVCYLLSIASIASITAFLGAQNILIVYRAKEIKIQTSLFGLVIVSGLVVSSIVFF